jgi:hypothetical protein
MRDAVVVLVLPVYHAQLVRAATLAAAEHGIETFVLVLDLAVETTAISTVGVVVRVRVIAALLVQVDWLCLLALA